MNRPDPRTVRRDIDLLFEGVSMRAYTKTIDGQEVKFIGGTASSTAIDLYQSIISSACQVKMLEKLRALATQMSSENSGLTAWLNHSYKIPEDTLGAFTNAALTTRSEGGEEFIDLDIECRVIESNPRALAAWQQVKEGIRHGWSIGAIFLDGHFASDDPASPDYWTFIVDDINLLEISLVGIPANQRAWCRSEDDLKNYAVETAERIARDAAKREPAQQRELVLRSIVNHEAEVEAARNAAVHLRSAAAEATDDVRVRMTEAAERLEMRALGIDSKPFNWTLSIDAAGKVEKFEISEAAPDEEKPHLGANKPADEAAPDESPADECQAFTKFVDSIVTAGAMTTEQSVAFRKFWNDEITNHRDVLITAGSGLTLDEHRAATLAKVVDAILAMADPELRDTARTEAVEGLKTLGATDPVVTLIENAKFDTEAAIEKFQAEATELGAALREADASLPLYTQAAEAIDILSGMVTVLSTGRVVAKLGQTFGLHFESAEEPTAEVVTNMRSALKTAGVPNADTMAITWSKAGSDPTATSPDDNKDLIAEAISHVAKAVGHGLCIRDAKHIGAAIDCLSAAVGSEVDQPGPSGSGEADDTMAFEIKKLEPKDSDIIVVRMLGASEESIRKARAVVQGTIGDFAKRILFSTSENTTVEIDNQIAAKRAELDALDAQIVTANEELTTATTGLATVNEQLTATQKQLDDLNVKIAEAKGTRLGRRGAVPLNETDDGTKRTVGDRVIYANDSERRIALARFLSGDSKPAGRDSLTAR